VAATVTVTVTARPAVDTSHANRCPRHLVMLNDDHFMVPTMTTMVNYDDLLFGVQRR
jgi:hypothetical protein